MIQTELSATLGVSQDQTLFCLEGNGARDSHRGDGFKESDTMYTLNTVEQHAVCIGNGQLHDAMQPDTEVSKTLNCMADPMKIITYGLDRASFNQGQNSQYDFSIEEELAQTIVAKGVGGGVNPNLIGALCARDYKGVGTQYVTDGKCIIERLPQAGASAER